jgi:hypothetical protein
MEVGRVGVKMKLSVNDWQDFSLKKDIEKLNKLVQRTCETGSTVVFDIAVAFGAIIFDRLFDYDNNKIVVVVYLIATLLIIASLVRLFSRKIITLIRNNSITVSSRDVREYIDSFDNEIWCYVMMSDSFLDLLTNDITADNHRKTFYYSQTCFWVNKSIKKLFGMIRKLNKIFANKNTEIVILQKVSVARLTNLLDIILNIKKTAYEEKNEFEILDEYLTANEDYDKMLDMFIKKVHDEFK